MWKPTTANATSHFLNANSRPAAITVWDNNVASAAVYAIVGHGESQNYLAWKRPNSDWQRVPYPTGVTSLYEVTGLSAVSFPTQAGRQPMIYAMSVATSSGVGFPTAKLWQYQHTASGTGTWTTIGTFARVTGQTGTPAIAAGWRSSTNETWVAVRAFGSSTSGTAMYACRASGTPTCSAITCDGAGATCANALVVSPVGIDFGSMSNTAYGTINVAEVFAVDTAQHLRHYRFPTNTAQADAERIEDLGVPGDPIGAKVDVTGISVRPGDGSLANVQVLVAGTPAQSGAVSTLQLLQRTTSGGNPDKWQWLHVRVPGTSSDIGIDAGIGNLWLDTPPGTSSTRVWFVSANNELDTCVFSSIPNTAWTNCWTSRPAETASTRPTDGRPGFDRMGPAFSVSRETVWMNASVGRQDTSGLNPEYVYSAPVNATGNWVAFQWVSHLTYRDLAMVLPGATQAAEYAASEFYGTISLVGIERWGTVADPTAKFIRTWRSTDDGQTWTTCPSSACPGPFGNETIVPQSSDPGTAIGPDGRVFVMAVRPPTGTMNNDRVDITSWNTGAGQWNSPATIPQTVTDIDDRPWLAVDPTTPGRFYVSYTGTLDGRLTYCTEEFGSSCVTPSPTGWCDPINLGSASHCNGDKGRPGCPVVVSENGTAWVAVADDNECRARTDAIPSGYPGDGLPVRPFTSFLGMRRIVLDQNHCPTVPVLDACIRYVASGDETYDITMEPFGTDREWAARLSATSDGSNRLVVTTRSFRDLDTGGPCQEVSGQIRRCRSDVFAVAYDPGRASWCGSSCVKDPFPDTMLQLTGLGESVPLNNQNYFMPSVVPLDFGAIGMAWLHGRINGQNYGIDALFGSVQVQSTDGTLAPVGTSRLWSQTSSVDVSSNSTSWYGDFTEQAHGRLHAHFFEPNLPSQTSGAPVTTLWSPSVHAAGP